MRPRLPAERAVAVQQDGHVVRVFGVALAGGVGGWKRASGGGTWEAGRGHERPRHPLWQQMTPSPTRGHGKASKQTKSAPKAAAWRASFPGRSRPRSPSPGARAHTRARTHAHTHTHTRTRTHAHTHARARAHTRARTHTPTTKAHRQQLLGARLAQDAGVDGLQVAGVGHQGQVDLGSGVQS